MNKNNSVAMTMRRLRGRERLMRLASEAPAYTTGNREWDRLKAYLMDWASRQVEIAAPRKDFTESCLAEYMKAESPTASSLLSGSDDWAMSVIDASIADLLSLEHGVEMHAAIRMRYLNEGLTKEAGMRVRVFRSNRLQHLSLVEADDFCDRAEIAMISMVKRRNLPL